MSIATTKVAETFVNIATGVDINCNWPLYSEDEVVCWYGKASLKAIKNTDYIVTLNEPSYSDFKITPLQPWLDKIAALIVLDGTETNYTTVRRRTGDLTSVTADNVHDTVYLRDEINRLWANIQEIAEQLAGAITLEGRYVGDVNAQYTAPVPVAGRSLVGKPDGSGYTTGPTADEIANAQPYAVAAAASAAAAAATAASIGLTGTSASNVTVGSGSKAFTTQAGKSWIAGQRIRVATADLTKVMDGAISSYVGTTLTVTVDYTEGAGSASAWNIGVTGARGATGATGATGPAGPGSGDMLASVYDAAAVGGQLVNTGTAQNVSGKTFAGSSMDGTCQTQAYRPTNAQTDSYTLVLADSGKYMSMTKATALSLTVPPNASVAFPIGTEIDLGQEGAGQLSVVAGAGVTILSKDGNLKLTKQYSGATLKKRATNTWVLYGDLTA